MTFLGFLLASIGSGRAKLEPESNLNLLVLYAGSTHPPVVALLLLHGTYLATDDHCWWWGGGRTKSCSTLSDPKHVFYQVSAHFFYFSNFSNFYLSWCVVRFSWSTFFKKAQHAQFERWFVHFFLKIDMFSKWPKCSVWEVVWTFFFENLHFFKIDQSLLGGGGGGSRPFGL